MNTLFSKPNSTAVSFIVQIHDNELFTTCLDSICNQSIQEIEIICIGNFLSSRSQNLITSYLNKDPRIKLINIDKTLNNSAARNLALQKASGKYLRMVDSHDVIPDTSTKVLFNVAERYKSHFVKGSSVSVSINNREKQQVKNSTNQITINTTIQNDRTLWEVDQHDLYLYKTDQLLASGTEYSDSFQGNNQELAFMLDLMPSLQKVTSIPEVVYCHRNTHHLPTFTQKNELRHINILNIYKKAYQVLPPQGLGQVADYIFCSALCDYLPETIFPLIKKELSYNDAKEFLILLKSLFAKLTNEQLFSLEKAGQQHRKIIAEIKYFALLLHHDYYNDAYHYLDAHQKHVAKEHERCSQLERKEQQLKKILNSTSWKITSPLRKIHKTYSYKSTTYLKRHAHNQIKLLKKHVCKYFKKTKISIKICAPRNKDFLLWGDTHFAGSFAKALEKNGFQTEINSLEEWYCESTHNSDIVIHLRGLSPYTPGPNSFNILWIISHPADISTEECELYDMILVASPFFAHKLKKQLTKPVHTFLQATDATRFKPTTIDNALKADILFVGNTRNQIRPSIIWASALDKDLHIYGNGWEKQDIPSNLVKGKYFPNERLNTLYSSAKIILNDHWPDMKDYGFISNRLFDSLASNSFIISDDVHGIHEIFEGAIPTFKSRKDFNNIVQYFLANPKKRKELATIGREVILRRHTFAIRAKQLKKIISLYQ